MKKAFVVLLLCVTTTLVHAQSKCNINKAWAFYTVSYPGVQMADENGNPIPPKAAIDRYIYIEWCGSRKPVIKEVLINNMSFTAVLEKVDGRSVIPGKDLSPENKTRIRATKCKTIWKITLTTNWDGMPPEAGSKNIIIKMRSPGCVFKMTKETLLKTLPRP